MTESNEDKTTATEARAGATPHVTRYVLGFGLVGVIAVFALLLFVWA